jgi:WD40 repeat protein
MNIPYQQADTGLSIKHSGHISEKFFYVSDTCDNLFIYKYESLQAVKSLPNPYKKNDESCSLSYRDTVVSPTAQCVIHNGRGEICIIDVKKKKKLHQIKTHRSGMDNMKFFPLGNYLVTTGRDGKVFLWCMKTGNKIDYLKPHTDSVSAIAISQDERLVATASYDRRLHVTNRSYRNRSVEMILHGTITDMHFITDYRLLTCDKEGNVLLWSLEIRKVVKRFEKFTDSVISAHVLYNESFLIVCGRSGIVSLYDFESGYIIERSYLTTESQLSDTSYNKMTNILVCTGLDGSINRYDFGKSEVMFQEAVEAGQLAKSIELLNVNPMLKATDAYRKLHTSFQTDMDKGRKALELGKIEIAEFLLSKYNGCTEYRIDIQSLFSDYKFYDKFARAYKSKRYAIAYGLAEANKTLQHSTLFKRMEREWEKALQTASKLEKNEGFREALKSVFSPFTGVTSKTTIINNYYTNSTIISTFTKKVASAEYEYALNMLQRHRFLTEYPAYATLIDVSQRMFEEMEDNFYSGRFHDAAKFARELKVFDTMKEYCETIEQRSDVYATAADLYASNQYSKVYSLIEKHQYLAEAEIGIELEKEFRLLLRKAEHYAFRGSVEGIKQVMQPYLEIRAKEASISHLIKYAYCIQIEKLVKSCHPGVSAGIRAYLDYFGCDEQLYDTVTNITTDVELPEPYYKVFAGSVKRLPDRIIEA